MVGNSFDQLVIALDAPHVSTDVIERLIFILAQKTNESLLSFINQSYQSVLFLERCMWKFLSEEKQHQWLKNSSVVKLFYSITSLNKTLIFNLDSIDTDSKAELLFPASNDQTDSIFKQINDTTNDNDTFVAIAALWFDNLAYFIVENPFFNALSTAKHLSRYIVHNYITSEQYQVYLDQLSQPNLLKSIFTTKMLFHIRTCSFYVYSCVGLGADAFPYTATELIRLIGPKYQQIVHIHCKNVALWSKELLSCMTHLICFMSGILWWDATIGGQANAIFSTEQIVCDHVEDLVRIVDHEPLQKLLKSDRSNDETSLIDGIIDTLMAIVKAQNVNWYFRANTHIQNTLLALAEVSPFDQICLCVYGILGKALTEEQMKGLKVCNTISGFFFNMLEQAWNHPSKQYKRIPVDHLLDGFLNLCKHDFIQQRTADMNKIGLLTDITNEYPIAYETVWALSFNYQIQQQLRQNTPFIDKLKRLSNQTTDEQIRKAVDGILWNLQIHQQSHPSTDISSQNTFDIMISYSHKDTSLCKQIYDELTRRNYRVWIDFDQMHGNVMDAMAQAIDRSRTIIICMSEEYRKSNFCRAEAHYAFQQQRHIVPVLLQKHYKPDGWLLFLIGQLLYVNFTKYEFDQAIEILMKELKDAKCVQVAVVPNCSISSGGSASLRVLSTEPAAPQNILEWTSVYVHNWLIDHKLMQMSRLLVDHDGRSLLYFNRYIKNGATKQTLKSLQEECVRQIGESLSLLELARLQSLIDREKQFARLPKSAKHN
ncbi:unnamed protein product [Adineta ricciae]|uniref:TIR domain-containing protein n=1 Tax=Adineta ricciae TaxID=249248 RepID=A0A815VI00_ADIRI|nr:unnamed protein product [Adineta ricciae]